jgi:hypothetical protein
MIVLCGVLLIVIIFFVFYCRAIKPGNIHNNCHKSIMIMSDIPDMSSVGDTGDMGDALAASAGELDISEGETSHSRFGKKVQMEGNNFTDHRQLPNYRDQERIGPADLDMVRLSPYGLPTQTMETRRNIRENEKTFRVNPDWNRWTESSRNENHYLEPTSPYEINNPWYYPKTGYMDIEKDISPYFDRPFGNPYVMQPISAWPA